MIVKVKRKKPLKVGDIVLYKNVFCMVTTANYEYYLTALHGENVGDYLLNKMYLFEISDNEEILFIGEPEEVELNV